MFMDWITKRLLPVWEELLELPIVVTLYRQTNANSNFSWTIYNV